MANDDTMQQPHASPFERIRQLDDQGNEFWSARDLATVLGYTEYGKFTNTIQKAETACANSGQAVPHHFAHVSDMIRTGKGAQRSVANVYLSRYACYLVVQNADPSKEIVALGQTYFAVRTREAEVADELAGMTESSADCTPGSSWPRITANSRSRRLTRAS
jgi:DNA-damage-inducible protein D